MKKITILFLFVLSTLGSATTKDTEPDKRFEVRTMPRNPIPRNPIPSVRTPRETMPRNPIPRRPLPSQFPTKPVTPPPQEAPSSIPPPEV